MDKACELKSNEQILSFTNEIRYKLTPRIGNLTRNREKKRRKEKKAKKKEDQKYANPIMLNIKKKNVNSS